MKNSVNTIAATLDEPFAATTLLANYRMLYEMDLIGFVKRPL